MSDRLTPESAPGEAAGLLALSQRVAALKAVPRTGWLDRGVAPERVESVADHTAGVALLAWASAAQRRAEGVDIDPERVLLLALVHDLAEAETGDSPPYDPASVPDESDPDARRAFLDRRHHRDESRAAAKRAAEDAAMRSLLAALPTAVRQELSAIWDELREGVSVEARFVKQADRLETFLQSLVYQRDDTDLPMASFRKETLETIDDPLLAAIRDEALAHTP